MIVYSSRFLTRGEVWFDNEPDDAQSVDWIIYHQRSRPVPRAKWRYFYTSIIDLTQSREQLVAQLNQDTAYKIRRARDRDKILCEGCDPRDPAIISLFEQMYNQFAAMKGLYRLDRARMESMAAAGVLDLSVAKDPRGNALVYHANYRDRCRATELELPSLSAAQDQRLQARIRRTGRARIRVRANPVAQRLVGASRRRTPQAGQTIFVFPKGPGSQWANRACARQSIRSHGIDRS